MTCRTISRREFLRLSALGTAAAALAACAPAAGPVPPTSVPAAATSAPAVPTAAPTNAPARAKVRVTFMVPGSQQEDADFAPVFEAFNKMYPDIEGAYTPAGTGYTPQYDTKLLTMLAGGVAPDVFKTQLSDYSSNFGALAAKGVYLPLDDLIKANPDITQLDDFFPAHVEGCKYQGKMLALPNDGAPTAIWYNVDLYQKANLKAPDWDWTWDTLTENAKALTTKDGNVFTQHGTTRPELLSTLWSNGGEVLDTEGKKCLLDKPEAVEALTWLQDLAIKYQVIPSPQSLSEQNEADRFTTGRVGNIYGVRQRLGALRTVEKFKFDVAPLVMSNKRKRVSKLAIGWTSVWKGSKNPDPAYKLAAYICSAEGQKLRISRGFAHPSRKSLVTQDWFQKYSCKMCNSTNVNTVFPDTLSKGQARAWLSHPKDAEIFQAVKTYLDYLWDGSKSARQVADELTKAIDKALAS